MTTYQVYSNRHTDTLAHFETSAMSKTAANMFARNFAQMPHITFTQVWQGDNLVSEFHNKGRNHG